MLLHLNVLSCLWVQVSFGETKVYGIDLGNLLRHSNQKVVRLDVSVDESSVVDGLYS